MATGVARNPRSVFSKLVSEIPQKAPGGWLLNRMLQKDWGPLSFTAKMIFPTSIDSL